MTPFAGVRVLVVEDEGAIAMLIEEMLEDLGCEIVASVARLAAAQDRARTAQIDLAILDVNLAGERVFPVAQILRSRGIAFLFSTGYGASGVPAEFADYPVLHKPFSEGELQHKMGMALRGSVTGAV